LKKTIQDLFNLIPPESIKFMVANSAIMSLDRGSKNKHPNIKVALPEETVSALMQMNEKQPALLVLTVDRDVWERAAEKLKDS